MHIAIFQYQKKKKKKNTPHVYRLTILGCSGHLAYFGSSTFIILLPKKNLNMYMSFKIGCF